MLWIWNACGATGDQQSPIITIWMFAQLSNVIIYPFLMFIMECCRLIFVNSKRLSNVLTIWADFEYCFLKSFLLCFGAISTKAVQNCTIDDLSIGNRRIDFIFIVPRDRVARFSFTDYTLNFASLMNTRTRNNARIVFSFIEWHQSDRNS